MAETAGAPDWRDGAIATEARPSRAHAYATGATIVTANTDEFKRIRGLNVENWLA